MNGIIVPDKIFRDKLSSILSSCKRFQIQSEFATEFFSMAEIEQLRKLYLSYEFSDKVRMLEDSPQYGDLLNYVETGLLTWEEAEKAALM